MTPPLGPVTAGPESADDGRVRVDELQAGKTYVVEVPERLPPGRYPHGEFGSDTWWWWHRLSGMGGGRFRLTVTAISTEVDPPTVEGVRLVRDIALKTVELTDEQAEHLGVPPGEWHLVGELYDTAGQRVYLPDTETFQVPARWLHDPQEPRPPHRDLDDDPWH